ncbi:MAG: hypothetical protein ACOYN0_18020, partial [Phycisphaerales bacterium]
HELARALLEGPTSRDANPLRAFELAARAADMSGHRKIEIVQTVIDASAALGNPRAAIPTLDAAIAAMLTNAENQDRERMLAVLRAERARAGGG